MAEIRYRIKELRKEKGLKQTELADQLGVNVYTVSKWEIGTRVPHDENLTMLCDFFDVNRDYLLGGKYRKEPEGLECKEVDEFMEFMETTIHAFCRLNSKSKQEVHDLVSHLYQQGIENGDLVENMFDIKMKYRNK